MSPKDPTFAEFYAVYRAQHRHPLNRALHLLAKLLAGASLLMAVAQRSLLLLLAAPVLAVAPCWLGHLWFEGNRPTSWERPSASLLGTLAGWARLLARIFHFRSTRSDAAPALSERASGRPYYSFLADLRMCGALLVSWPTTDSPAKASKRM